MSESTIPSERKEMHTCSDRFNWLSIPSTSPFIPLIWSVWWERVSVVANATCFVSCKSCNVFLAASMVFPCVYRMTRRMETIPAMRAESAYHLLPHLHSLPLTLQREINLDPRVDPSSPWTGTGTWDLTEEPWCDLQKLPFSRMNGWLKLPHLNSWIGSLSVIFWFGRTGRLDCLWLHSSTY